MQGDGSLGHRRRYEMELQPTQQMAAQGMHMLPLGGPQDESGRELLPENEENKEGGRSVSAAKDDLLPASSRVSSSQSHLNFSGGCGVPKEKSVWLDPPSQDG